MKKMPTYDQLVQKNNQLEQEVLEYIRKENEFKKKMKSAEYIHIRRTLLLIKINEELNKEIEELKTADKEKLEYFSRKLKDRFKELRFLYGVSSRKEETNLSMDNVLQEVVELIPPAIEGSEKFCARIVLDNSYEIKTKNFQYTKCKLAKEIRLNNKRVGQLEVYYLKKDPQKESCFDEANILIQSFAENIAQIIDHEWLESEINKIRVKIENIIRH